MKHGSFFAAAAMSLSSQAFAGVSETVTAKMKPISESAIVDEFLATCVASYPSEEALRDRLKQSSFDYRQTEPTMDGSRLNWETSFGWLGFVEALPGNLASWTPQCDFNAFTAAPTNHALLETNLMEALVARYGADHVTFSEGRWHVSPAENSRVAIDRVERGSANQAILLALPDATSKMSPKGAE